MGEHGTYRTVKARSWPWLPIKSPSNLSRCSNLARQSASGACWSQPSCSARPSRTAFQHNLKRTHNIKQSWNLESSGGEPHSFSARVSPPQWTNTAHVSQSKPHSGVGCQVKVLKPSGLLSLRSEEAGWRADSAAAWCVCTYILPYTTNYVVYAC